MTPGRTVWPGRPYPLGAQRDGYGAHFAVFSNFAERPPTCRPRCTVRTPGSVTPRCAELPVLARSLWLFRSEP